MNKKVRLLSLCILSLSTLAEMPQEKKLSTTTNLTTSLESMVTSTFDLIKSVSLPSFVTSSTVKRKIVFDNVITEKMITFTGHWAKPYPSTFTVSVNDHEFITLNRRGKIAVKEKEFEVAKDNTLTIVYEWAIDKFGKRWHHEKKEVTFQAPENTKSFDISFGFDCQSRVLVPQAKLLNCNQLISKTNT